MIPQVVSTDAIRAMDGPSLTHLAWEMGLDPRGLKGWRHFSWQQRSWGEAAIDASGNIWCPHERLDQADAVFRGLRERNWDTHVQYFAQSGTGQIGYWKRRESQRLGGLLSWQDPAKEAETLLRATVLAVTSEKE